MHIFLDKADIRPDAALELDKLVKILKDNPSIRIELSSHTDSRSNDSYNLNLSQRRAQSAVDYIVSQGIAERVKYVFKKCQAHCIFSGIQVYAMSRI